MGLHGIVLHAREGIAVLDDQVGVREGGAAAPALEVELVADIAPCDGLERREIGEVAGQGLSGVDERRAGGQRLLDRGDGGERLVVDVDPLERLAGRGLVLGDRRGHRLALVAHHVDGEDGAVAEGGAEVRVAPVEVGAGDHGVDAGHGARGARVDRPDPRVRVRRAQERGVQHPRPRQIGDVARPSRDLVQRVGPRHGSADDAERAARGLTGRGAAHARMASTIFR